jgi:hypothetical protein
MASEHSTLVETILSHLCGKGIYGDVTEWCEMRHDCVYVVTCPDCNDTFTLGEEEYEALVRRSQEVGLACGIRPLPA